MELGLLLGRMLHRLLAMPVTWLPLSPSWRTELRVVTVALAV